MEVQDTALCQFWKPGTGGFQGQAQLSLAGAGTPGKGGQRISSQS